MRRGYCPRVPPCRYYYKGCGVRCQQLFLTNSKPISDPVFPARYPSPSRSKIGRETARDGLIRHKITLPYPALFQGTKKKTLHPLGWSALIIQFLNDAVQCALLAVGVLDGAARLNKSQACGGSHAAVGTAQAEQPGNVLRDPLTGHRFAVLPHQLHRLNSALLVFDSLFRLRSRCVLRAFRSFVRGCGHRVNLCYQIGILATVLVEERNHQVQRFAVRVFRLSHNKPLSI